MTHSVPSLLTAAVLAVAACSTDRLAGNVYEGIQQRNQALKTPQEKSSEPPPQSYRDYERERVRLKNETVAR